MASATLRNAHTPRDADETLTSSELEQLRQRLNDERAAVISRVTERLALAAPLESRHPDEMDEAQSNQDLALLFRLADKEQKLLAEIDAALQRLDDGSYGFCEGTGEAIGFGRLLARPWARYSVAHKEALERQAR
jgi:DnaK suppressor protein